MDAMTPIETHLPAVIEPQSKTVFDMPDLQSPISPTRSTVVYNILPGNSRPQTMPPSSDPVVENQSMVQSASSPPLPCSPCGESLATSEPHSKRLDVYQSLELHFPQLALSIYNTANNSPGGTNYIHSPTTSTSSIPFESGESTGKSSVTAESSEVEELQQEPVNKEEEIAELQASLKQAAFERDISETDIRDEYKAKLEDLYGIENSYLNARREVGNLQEELEEEREDGRKKGLKVDQLYEWIWEHARVNLLLEEQLAEKKNTNNSLVEEKIDMQKVFDNKFESLRENHKEKEARLEAHHAEELAQKDRYLEKERGHLRAHYKEELKQKEKQMKDRIDDLETQLRNERARKLARPSKEQKPDEPQVDALKTRFNDVLRQNEILKSQRDGANQDKVIFFQELEGSRATIVKERDAAIEQIRVLTKALKSARGDQQGFDILREQHQAALSKVSDLEIALQQARRATQALQEKFDLNERNYSQEKAGAAAMRQNTIIKDLEQALAEAENHREVSELNIKTLESELVLNLSLEYDFPNNIRRQHEEEAFNLKAQISAVSSPDELKPPQKRAKRLRGTKVRKLVYSGKQSLWHTRFKNSDYSTGRIGFGLEEPRPLSKMEIYAVEKSILLEQNGDATVLFETLNDSSLDSSAAVSMNSEINYDQYTSAGQDNVLVALGIPVVESTTLSNVMDASNLGSHQVENTTVAAKRSRPSASLRGPSRNFCYFFIWFFIMALQWLCGYQTNSGQSTIRNASTQVFRQHEDFGCETGMPKPISITWAPTMLFATTTVPPVAAKTLLPNQTLFPTMVISPYTIPTPYRIVELTSLREGPIFKRSPTLDFNKTIPMKKGHTGKILGLFGMVVVASTLCAESFI